MIADLRTIISKELREFLAANGSRRGGILGVLIILVVSIVLPLSIGVGILTSPIVIAVYGIYVPMAMVMAVVADSFAGERERHTLETLLATRLSDRAILFGKLGASVLYGWGIALLGWLVSAATVDITHPNALLFYTPTISLATVVAGLLTSCLMAGIGVLVSLRAATVRQAQQIMGVVFLVFYFIPFIALTVLPNDIRDNLLHWLFTTNWTQVGIVAGVILAALDVVLLGLAMVRFQRARLITG